MVHFVASSSGRRELQGQSRCRAARRSRVVDTSARIRELASERAALTRLLEVRLPAIDKRRKLAQLLHTQGEITTLELLDTQETWLSLHDEAIDWKLSYRLRLAALHLDCPCNSLLPEEEATK